MEPHAPNPLNLLDAAGAPQIVGGYSEAFYNGDLRPGYTQAAWGNSFVQQTHPLDEAIKHLIVAGKSAVFGAFKGDSRTSDTFRYTQVGMIDAEAPQVGNAGVAEALAVDFNRRHAVVCYPTRTSGKVTDKNPHGYRRSRIGYLFSEPVAGVERARAIYRALGMASEMPVDPASHKPAQPWHGSTNRIEQPHINLQAEPVNIQWLAGYLIDEARAEMERDLAPKPPTITPTGTRAEKYSAGARARILDEYYRVPAHAGQRHDAFVKMTADLYSLQFGGWHGCENVDPLIYEAGRATERADAEIRDAIKWARTHATPKPFEIPDNRPLRGVIRKQADDDGAPPTHYDYVNQADHTISAAHIEALPVESAAVQSAVGTGKTTQAIREMERSSRAMYITHRRALADQFVETAARNGVIVEHYSELPKAELYRVPRLSICINTLVLYVKSTGELPPAPDLLVIDEISQFIEATLDEGTLAADEQHIADQIVRHMISSARRVLVMDAHMSAAALDYVRSARPGLPLVDNTYQPTRGELYIVERRSRAVGEAQRAAMEGRRVAVASFGVTSGQAIADQLASVIDDPARVLFVHADNSGEQRQADFLRDPNGEASKYQVIVYSPVIGTGYSIETPFDVLVALASQEQSAEDVRQFIGRFRNVTRTYAWLPNNQDTRETDAQALTERLIAAAERTAHPFIADGRLLRAISTQARQFVTHHAAVRAARNASMNDLRQRFVTLCAGSYTIRTLDGDDQTTAALINARMTEIDDKRRALALTAEPVDADTYKRKQDAGRVTEPEHAGHIRWQIEAMTGLKISPELRDRLWTDHRRRAAQRFADLLDDVTALQLADMEQAQGDTPLHRRAHRTPRRYVTEAFLRPLVDDGQPVEYSTAELEALYRPLIEHHAEALRVYFGWYPYRVNTAAGIIRLVLRRLGLTLSGDRRRVDGDRVKFYRLDVTDYCAAVEIARAIVAQRQVERDADLAEKVGLPVPKLQKPLYSRSLAVLGQPTLPPIPEAGATGWAAHPALFNQRIAALTAPIGAQV